MANVNGVVSPNFLRVKKLSDKAVIPTRGSTLSAGYNLSSAADTKVPARGKALIPTDLSIAVPQGTYARVGNSSFPLSNLLLFITTILNFEILEF
jgi:dUTP pyrophosphatase